MFRQRDLRRGGGSPGPSAGVQRAVEKFSERYQLSRREQDVLFLSLRGKALKEAAATLDISVKTVADRKYKRGALALTIPCAARLMPDKLTFCKLFAAPHPPDSGSPLGVVRCARVDLYRGGIGRT